MMTNDQPKYKCRRCAAFLPSLDKFAGTTCPSCCDRQYPEQVPIGSGTAVRYATMMRGGPLCVVTFTQERGADPAYKGVATWGFRIADARIVSGQYTNHDFAAHYVEEAAWEYVAKVIGPITRWASQPF